MGYILLSFVQRGPTDSPKYNRLMQGYWSPSKLDADWGPIAEGKLLMSIKHGKIELVPN